MLEGWQKLMIINYFKTGLPMEKCYIIEQEKLNQFQNFVKNSHQTLNS